MRRSRDYASPGAHMQFCGRYRPYEVWINKEGSANAAKVEDYLACCMVSSQESVPVMLKILLWQESISLLFILPSLTARVSC